MGPEEVLVSEHTRIIADIRALMSGRDTLSAAFEELMLMFEYHTVREEESFIPLLGLVTDLTDPDKARIGKLEQSRHTWNIFKMEMDTMLSEHRDIFNLLDRIQEIPSYRQFAMARDLVASIRSHMIMEEQLLYPAARAAGRLLEIANANGGFVS